MIAKKKKVVYIPPKMRKINLWQEGCICQSPGGGGSEGTGDEPLFAPGSLFDEDLIDSIQ